MRPLGMVFCGVVLLCAGSCAGLFALMAFLGVPAEARHSLSAWMGWVATAVAALTFWGAGTLLRNAKDATD